MLKDSIVKFLKLDSLMDNLTGYVETRIDLLKYELKEDISKIVAKVALYAVVSLVFLFFLFFISLATAIKIGDALGDVWGFTIVGLFYVTLGIALLLLREVIHGKLEKGIKGIIQKTK